MPEPGEPRRHAICVLTVLNISQREQDMPPFHVRLDTRGLGRYFVAAPTRSA